MTFYGEQKGLAKKRWAGERMCLVSREEMGRMNRVVSLSITHMYNAYVDRCAWVCNGPYRNHEIQHHKDRKEHRKHHEAKSSGVTQLVAVEVAKQPHHHTVERVREILVPNGGGR